MRKAITGIPKPLEAIRAAVKKEIKRQNRTQREVANAVGVSDVHLCNMLGGFAWPSVEVLDELLETLGLEIIVRRRK